MEKQSACRKRKEPPTTTDGMGDSQSTPGSATGAGSVTVGKCRILENGKRRVRKGTKSCWQCRRRKIKCEYKNTGDSICIRCTEKGEACRSQEYPEHPGPDEAPESNGSTVRSVHQRLADMEKALQAVVNAVGPRVDIKKQGVSAARGYPGSVDYDSARDDFEDFDGDGDYDGEEEDHIATTRPSASSQLVKPSSTMKDTANFASNNTRHRNVLSWRCSLPSPPGSETYRMHMYMLPPVLPRSQKLDTLRTKLLPLFPPQSDIDRIFENSSGVYFVMSSMFPIQKVIGCRVPAIQDMRILPPPTSHPLLMAKKLLQLAVIIQHIEPTLDRSELSIKKPLSVLTEEWMAAVSMMVTNDDDLIGNLEGLECLLMKCLYLANIGSLRKAWIICRRAISFAQLMGLGQGGRSVVPSVDTDTPAAWKTSPDYMWYRLNFFDRYTSLLLGLPSATQDETFARPEALALLSPTERLERILTVASARISERNTMRPANARDVTLRIYNQISEVAQTLGSEWWGLPDLREVPLTAEALSLSLQVMVQMHFFSLVIILHLPYMMKGVTMEQREYSKGRCLVASREVLSRFCSMRSSAVSAMSCRHIDYTALVGSMTLLLSYLDHGPKKNANTEASCETRGTPLCNPSEQRMADRKLIMGTQNLLDDMAKKTNDKLTAEAASIVKQLLPIIDTGGPLSATGLCKINVPYLGTVTLRPNQQPAAGDGCCPSAKIGSTAADFQTQGQKCTVETHSRSATPVPTTSGEPPRPFSMTVDMRPEESGLLDQIPELHDIGDLFSLDPNFQHYDFRGFEGHQFPLAQMGQNNPQKHGNSIDSSNTMDQQSPLNNLRFTPFDSAASATTQMPHPVPDTLNGQAAGAAVRAQHPGITADAGRWAFQGVDTNYWTLLGQPFSDDIIRMMHESQDEQ